MNKLINSVFAKHTSKTPNVMIKRECYTMATSDGTEAEIIMYGEIVESQPVDWWTNEPIEGSYIIESEFLEDLKAVSGCKKLTIRMNSLGGDAGVSILIHNRLRELANAGTELICIVDGVAMSGGSLIMCACDSIKVNASSIIMIHKCWCFMFGGYNADDLRSVADQNDAWDKAQAAIYSRKCKLSESVISEMMRETTYMTGKEAIEKGFADELIEGEKLNIAASADRKTLFVNGRKLRLDVAGINMPETLNIPLVEPAEADEINKNMPVKSGSEGGKKPMAKNIEELRAEYPELTKQLETEAKATVPATSQDSIDAAIKAERTRQQEIDEIAPAINDEKLVQEAKYGEKPCSAQELAFRAMQDHSRKGKEYTADTAKDYKESNAEKVGSSPTGAEENPKEKVEETVDAGVKAAKAAFGGK